MQMVYNGFSLFNDMTDEDERDEQRAETMCLITDINLTEKGISTHGVSLLSGYLDLIPVGDRASVFVKYISLLRIKGAPVDMVLAQAKA